MPPRRVPDPPFRPIERCLCGGRIIRPRKYPQGTALDNAYCIRCTPRRGKVGRRVRA